MSTESSPEPTHEAAFFTTIRSWGIVRGDNRVFGGVLSGVGARIGMAPAPARIIFVLIALVTSGLGMLAYAAAWALLPDSEGRIIIQDFGRGRPNVGALVAIAVLVILSLSPLSHIGFDRNWPGRGLNAFDNAPNFFDYGGGHFFGIFVAIAITLLVLGGLAALIVWAVRSSKRANEGPQGFARLPDGTVPNSPMEPSAAAEPMVVAEPSAAAAEAVAYAVPGPAPTPPTPAPPAPRVYSAPPTPPRPRVPGPGAMGYLMALAWIPITLAITLYLSTTDQLAVFPVLVAGVIYVAGLGLILIITALRGRKLGFLGFVSVMALIPVTIAIGSATELREHYASGDWRIWFEHQVGPEVSVSAEATDPSTSIDPVHAFDDYTSVAINGTCQESELGSDFDSNGTVALSEVNEDQSITVSSTQTRLIIPEGIGLNIVSDATVNAPVSVDITWLNRDVNCYLNEGAKSGVQLTNGPDAPVLTVHLDDGSQVGQMSLYIQEN